MARPRHIATNGSNGGPRHALRNGRNGKEGTRRSATLLTVLVALAGGMLLADAAVPSLAGEEGTDVDVERSDLATSYCPVVAADGEEAAVLVAAVEDEPATVTLVHHDGPETRVSDEHELEPGERVNVDLEPAQPVTVRARGGATSAVWTVSGDYDATGPCVDEPADDFYLPAMDTTLGSEASLHLFNPFTVDAVVRVRYGTAEGAVDLVSTENVAVEAGSTQTVDLTEVQPEERDLGVVVETVAGRVVAQGEVERNPVDEEDDRPRGRALVPAATDLADEAFFAYAIDDDEAWSSRLGIFNPNDREAAVRVHATTPNPEAPVEEISVPAGGVAGLELGGRSQRTSFAVSVESLTELPILVGRWEGNADDPSGLAVTLGARSLASRWTTAGPAGAREDALSIYNPGDESVRVSATLGGQPVDSWQGRVLSGSGRQILDLGDARSRWPALVEADGPIAVEVVSTVADGDHLNRVVGLAEPLPVGESSVSVPRPRLDQSLATKPVLTETDEDED